MREERGGDERGGDEREGEERERGDSLGPSCGGGCMGKRDALAFLVLMPRVSGAVRYSTGVTVAPHHAVARATAGKLD